MSTIYNKLIFKIKTPSYHHKQSLWKIMRPFTLTGTINPIIIGSFVASKFGVFHIDRFMVLIIAAVLTQSGVNILNDYFDFANGQDLDKWYISKNSNHPFAHPKHKHLPLVAVIMFVIAALLGLWLAINSHLITILIGVLGMFAGYKYSAGGKQSFSALGLGEATAAIFLGFIPVLLAYIVQEIKFEWTGFTIGFIFALLISSMILTNNIRDIYKDKGFRQTIAIRIGKNRSVLLLMALITGVYLSGTLLIISQILPPHVLIFYLAIPFAYRLIKALTKNNLNEINVNLMKLATKHHWIFSLLLILGLLINMFIY